MAGDFWKIHDLGAGKKLSLKQVETIETLEADVAYCLQHVCDCEEEIGFIKSGKKRKSEKDVVNLCTF